MNTIPFAAAGNLTEDPSLRFTTTAKPVASIRLAITPRRYDTTAGAYVDGTTTFIDADIWGQQAEHVAESLHRGDRVIVTGRWVTRTFTPTSGPNDGKEQRRLEVVVDEIGPSLQWATTTVERTAKRSEMYGAPEEEPSF